MEMKKNQSLGKKIKTLMKKISRKTLQNSDCNHEKLHILTSIASYLSSEK